MVKLIEKIREATNQDGKSIYLGKVLNDIVKVNDSIVCNRGLVRIKTVDELDGFDMIVFENYVVGMKELMNVNVFCIFFVVGEVIPI